MPFTIYKDTPGKRFFKLKVRLAVTADGRAVPDTHPEAKRMLGGIGSLVSEEDAKKYKLDASQVETEAEEKVYVPPKPEPPKSEPVPEVAPEASSEPKPKKKADKEA